MAISSVSNPAIRRVRRLRKRAWRERRSLVLVEGHRAVAAAAASGAELPEAFHTARAERLRPSLLEAVRAAGARLHEVTPEVMAHLTSVATAPDVLAVAPLRETGLDAVAGRSAVVLAGIRDPATVGSVMATASAAGMPAAVLGTGCADVFSPKCVRAAQGAHFGMDVVRDVDDVTAAAARLADAGARLVALGAGGVPPWEADLAGPAVVVIAGDPGAVPGKAERVAVPSIGTEPPLGAAAAVVLYEWHRRAGSVR